MKNTFLAKATANKSQLEDRALRGTKAIEIHLLDSEPKDELEVEIMTQNILDSGLKVLVVHSPMKRIFQVEGLINPESIERLKLVSRLAQNMSEHHGDAVVVVIHQEKTLAQIIDFGLIAPIEDAMEYLLQTYSNVLYAFENLPLLSSENGEMVSRSNYFNDSPKLAKYLKNKLKTDRIGSVLDTCHAIGTDSVLRLTSAHHNLSPLPIETFVVDFIYFFEDSF